MKKKQLLHHSNLHPRDRSRWNMKVWEEDRKGIYDNLLREIFITYWQEQYETSEKKVTAYDNKFFVT